MREAESSGVKRRRRRAIYLSNTSARPLQNTFPIIIHRDSNNHRAQEPINNSRRIKVFRRMQQIGEQILMSKGIIYRTLTFHKNLWKIYAIH